MQPMAQILLLMLGVVLNSIMGYRTKILSLRFRRAVARTFCRMTSPDLPWRSDLVNHSVLERVQPPDRSCEGPNTCFERGARLSEGSSWQNHGLIVPLVHTRLTLAIRMVAINRVDHHVADLVQAVDSACDI